MPIFSLSSIISEEIKIGNDTIKLDGITEVSSTNSRTITQHPTEDGYNISDAQHQMPIKASFQAWITDTPQSILDKRVYATLPNITGLSLVEGNIKKQLSKLEKAANDGELITLKTKYAIYSDFYIESFSYRETSKMAILINFSIMERQDNTDLSRETANFSQDIGLWSQQ